MELNQVTIPVRNMPEATAFYLKLGFTLIVDTPDYARFARPQGDSTLSLYLETENFANGATLYFESERLDERVADLIARDVDFVRLPTAPPYLWREAILKDPSGNRIKLYRAGQHRLAPPWKVNIHRDNSP